MRKSRKTLMKLYYRISDNSYPKAKLIGATKQFCLQNFLAIFGQLPIRIIADRCKGDTLNWLETLDFAVIQTDLGNAGSFRHVLDLAIQDEGLLYFCEDDYIHHPKSVKLIQEGIKRADYVTLYDHPDKYTRHYNGGEFSKVIRTESSHWRYTASTCMTFATTSSKLKEDYDVWEKYTNELHPHDHHIFTELGKKGRRLAVCIPGAACHTDLTFSGAMNQIYMDEWAIDMMIKMLENELAPYTPTIDKTGWQKLVALDAFRQNKSQN